MTPPEYRIRLFLSADLVGSTAFKAGLGRRTLDDQTYPLWVTLTNHFYRRFPAHMLASYKELRGAGGREQDDDPAPVLWKTIGDEIVLCCRLSSVDHLARCLRAFVKALDRYSRDLKAEVPSLDIKGTGWIAAFPAPNFTVFGSHTEPDDSELPDEALETLADSRPHEHDFLGSEIDSGFRLSQFSTSDKLVVSAGLALLLCSAAQQGRFAVPFNYDGRQSLRGVIDGHPYPIVSIDTERDPRKRDVRRSENKVTNHKDVDPGDLARFLRSFMEDEGLELPRLGEAAVPITAADLPPSYHTFIQRWTGAAEEITRRRAAEAESDRAEGIGSENRPALEANLDLMVPERHPAGPSPKGG